ncbi:rhomboid family intramembrane serine protease [Microvirga sp. P5_D2]
MPSSQSRLREPVFNLPPVVTISILVLAGIHLLRMFLSQETDIELVFEWAVIPARWAVAYGGVEIQEVVRHLQESAPGESIESLEALAQFVLADGEGHPLTAITHAFLHGSWVHLLLNSVWLAAFGTPIARRVGVWRFLLLAAVSAVAGALFYAFMNPVQIFPMIGASGAVSGLMGAASWFVFAPATWHWEGRLAQPHERPRQPLVEILGNRSFLVFIGVWFATNYLFAFVEPVGLAEGNIAWEAHVGGFLAGLFLFPWIDPIPARSRRISA